MLGDAHRLSNVDDERVILHFDYDCFYASVVEAEQPELRDKPLAIQQKQIIVTCNYVARERGLYKLQLITEAKKTCPEVVIVLGEDLTRFRDASKALYSFLRAFSWSDRAERLGFDEVWLDVTDMINFNATLLNEDRLEQSFFRLSRTNESEGFFFNAMHASGCCYPEPASSSGLPKDGLRQRLTLGSHLAAHLREQLYQQKGYTATVGIATNKILSKLVGNTNKPKNQTTLMPPYRSEGHATEGNAVHFMDAHDIGAIPGIGFKLAQKLREFALSRPASFDTGLVYGTTKESISSGEIRKYPEMSADLLERILAGPGSPKGIGAKVLALLHGVDDSEVIPARNVPRQISLEDSYIKLDTFDQLRLELKSLTTRLLERMRLDLTETQGLSDEHAHSRARDSPRQQRWIGKPSSLRLTTRPRLPVQSDGTRIRSFKRISRSAPMPHWVFRVGESLELHADKLVAEALLPLFRKLHPEKAGWNLSLVNVAATDIVDISDSSTTAAGQDISVMFRGQASIRRNSAWDDTLFESRQKALLPSVGAINMADTWESDSNSEKEDEPEATYECYSCGSRIPIFAKTAHERFHERVI